MAFFPREFYAPQTGFTPLFHLLDDIDNYSRHVAPRHHRNARGTHVPTFNPKFDVRELDDAFELHGELPGMDKKNVHIEFSDPQTLIIRGRIERSYQAGTPPTGLLEDTEMSGAIEAKPEDKSKNNDHHATVEDDPEETGSNSAAGGTTEVAKTVEKPKEQADKAKYWVSERSIGEFSRTFSFPGRVNQDAVRAKFEDGILTVTVPKAPKHEARRIDIS